MNGELAEKETWDILHHLVSALARAKDGTITDDGVLAINEDYFYMYHGDILFAKIDGKTMVNTYAKMSDNNGLRFKMFIKIAA